MKKYFFDNKRLIYGVHILIFILYVLFFYVISESSYTADDLLNSNTLALKYIGKENVWQQTIRIGKSWIEAGRFFPFSDYVYFLFYLVPSRLVYKILIIFSVYINSVLFSKCIEKISKSSALGLLMMFLFPMSIQLTGEFNSALYAFHMLMQMVFLWSLLSLLLIMKYIDLKDKNTASANACFIGSGIFLFVSLCTYEVAFVMIIFIVLGVLAYTSDIKYSIKVLIPDFIAYGVACIINVILRMSVHNVGYSGISINFNIKEIAVTFAKQSIGVLPMSRFIYKTYESGMPYSVNELISNIRLTDMIMVCIYAVLFVLLVLMLRNKFDKSCNYICLIIGGVSLMVLPAFLISVTSRYQKELDWGINHLSGYIQSFGMALVMACVVALIIKHISKAICIIFSIVLIMFNSSVMLAQEMEARAFNSSISWDFRYAVENIIDAANCGVFDDVSSDNIIYGISDYYYDNAESNMFYSKYLKKDMPVKTKTEFEKDMDTWSGNIENKSIYIINSYSNANGSYVYVAHVSEISDDIGNYSDNYKNSKKLYIDNIKIFTRYKNDFIIKYYKDNILENINISNQSLINKTDIDMLYEISGVNIPFSSLTVE